MKKKAMAAGVASPVVKAPSKKGAWIDVQKRTLIKSGKKK